MPDYRSMYDNKYIYAFDLKGKDVTLTIKAVKAEKLRNAQKGEEKKPAIWFKESHDDRGLVLCKTNAKIIATLYGNDTENWVGKRITLYPAKVDAFGQTVDAVRIRPQIPTGQASSAPGEADE